MDLGRLIEENPGLCRLARRARQDPDAPFTILTAKIKLTWRCNLRCRVCALWRLGGRPESQAMSAADIGALLAGLVRLGLRKVHFSGGEPLLREDFDEIVRRAVSLGLQVNLTTNGTLLDKDRARTLVDSRIHTVAFSLDAAQAKKHDALRGVEGAWGMTWKGIDRLQTRNQAKGRGPVVAVNTVVCRKNIEDMGALFSLLKERGIESWRLLPVRTADKKLRPTSDQWARLKDQWSDWRPLLTRGLTVWHSPRQARLAAKGRYAVPSPVAPTCLAPWFNLFIDADGAAYPCCTGRQTMPAYGNVLSMNLDDLPSFLGGREIRASLASGHPFEVCRTCDEFHLENEALERAARKTEEK